MVGVLPAHSHVIITVNWLHDTAITHLITGSYQFVSVMPSSPRARVAGEKFTTLYVQELQKIREVFVTYRGLNKTRHQAPASIVLWILLWMAIKVFKHEKENSQNDINFCKWGKKQV